MKAIFEITLDDRFRDDTLVISAVGYQAQYWSIELVLEQEQDSLLISLANSTYDLASIEISESKTRIGRFIAKVNFFPKLAKFFTQMKLKIPAFLEKINVQQIWDNPGLRTRLRQLIDDLQAALKERRLKEKDPKEDQQLREVIDKIQLFYQQL
ncbi:MAG: hypothetical protein HC880_11335 [Bacteroidia bacterium]|nr:hypothetical protein [Bacteroidia bacterium]